jgi:hypothetical protein
VLTPVAFIARLSGEKFLELKWDNTQPTYWNYRKEAAGDKSGYEKQF